jgi:hypothetical protein
VLEEALGKDEIRWLVSDPEDAAEIVRREKPSMLIIEDGAVQDASALAKEARAAEKELPIVLVSAPGDEDPLTNGVFDDQLIEPFSSSYARARLRAGLLRRASRWRRASKPKDEAKRIATLRALKVLDTPPEERFDRITRLAAAVFDVPVALISLVDENRQWFKSSCGIDARETPRDESFCAHAVVSRKPLIIPDAFLDNRFADNPLVTGPSRVRFYAGCPLFVSDGSCIGTLCILDTQPRELDQRSIGRLLDLAALATQEFERVSGATAAGVI